MSPQREIFLLEKLGFLQWERTEEGDQVYSLHPIIPSDRVKLFFLNLQNEFSRQKHELNFKDKIRMAIRAGLKSNIPLDDNYNVKRIPKYANVLTELYLGNTKGFRLYDTQSQQSDSVNVYLFSSDKQILQAGGIE